MLILVPTLRPTAKECLEEMMNWNSPSLSTSPQVANTARQIKVPRPRVPQNRVQGARHDQLIGVPQVRDVTARLGKPPDLFGAISSGDDLTTNGNTRLLDALRHNLQKDGGQRTRKEQNTEGKGKTALVASDEEYQPDTEKDADEAETFILKRGDAECFKEKDNSSTVITMGQPLDEGLPISAQPLSRATENSGTVSEIERELLK